MSETDEMSKSDSETSHLNHEDVDVDIMDEDVESETNSSSVIHHIIPVYPNRNREERKRRRVIGNSDNTLDGLVAKRAEIDPLTKRYQTETDAIVLPDDEVEMKKMENDPDVATRVCSVCGYQGKWVSEMIRHKRVHTNDRPFKCKYCSRTSKWKADLVRHVAKTHGIRVVSKYSRSKAFDANHDTKVDSMARSLNSPPHSIPVIKKAQITKETAKCFSSFIKESSTNNSMIPSFRCLTCFFEQDSIEVLSRHLQSVHNVSLFECLQCKRGFNDAIAANTHCSMPDSVCTPLSLKINFSPIYLSSKSQHSLSSATTSSPTTTTDSDSFSLFAGSDELIHTCNECPFKADTEEKLLMHQQNHGAPKGPFNYKCVFCSWYAKKKSAIEKHMSLHTSRPEEFMGQVERNLVTSATMDASKHLNMANSLPLVSLLANRLQGIPASPLLSVPLPTIPNDQLLTVAANHLLSTLLYPSAVAPVSTPTSLPDMMHQLANQPLLSFGLSSLLELHKNNLTKFEQTI